jgi:hypothetical protein
MCGQAQCTVFYVKADVTFGKKNCFKGIRFPVIGVLSAVNKYQNHTKPQTKRLGNTHM